MGHFRRRSALAAALALTLAACIGAGPTAPTQAPAATPTQAPPLAATPSPTDQPTPLPTVVLPPTATPEQAPDPTPDPTPAPTPDPTPVAPVAIEFGTSISDASAEIISPTTTFASGSDMAWRVELPQPTGDGVLQIVLRDVATGAVLASDQASATPGANVYYAANEAWISNPGEYELSYYYDGTLIAEGSFSVTQPAPTPAPTASPQPDPGAGCDPSYPTLCIAPAPPDIDCGDIRARDFRVRGDDPHNFDGDGDGIGCESGGGQGGGQGGGPQPTQKPRQEPRPGNCDPSYPTLCIPPNAPDLDCGDVRQKNFPVRGRDPHGFDGDGDGVGCES